MGEKPRNPYTYLLLFISSLFDPPGSLTGRGICPNVCNDGGGANAARARNLWSAFVLRPPWGDGARTGSVSAETRAEVCTPPAGCGQQSRDGMCYPRSMRNDWNSAKKFTQPE